MVTQFFNSEGIIFPHRLPLKQTTNASYYANTLKTHLRNAIEKTVLDKMVIFASR
jgi:hypothetical protein